MILKLGFTLALSLLCPNALAAGGGDCSPPSPGPDIIVGGLGSIQTWGTTGGVTGYSIATDSCNIGTAPANFISGGTDHPVIAQNMYRLKDGRFEQLGMSWLKHAFASLNGSTCCSCNNPGSGSLLGVGCSDPYGSGLNGSQGNLGPRSEVNPSSGLFSWPFGSQGLTGNAAYKRVQVLQSDLNPALNPGALYFAEGHYVAKDDAAAGNGHNNASYRLMNVGTLQSNGYSLSGTGATVRARPAIGAWEDNDPTVVLNSRIVGGDGMFWLGSKATDNGNGTWHYEYALYNHSSNRAGGGLTIPIKPGTTITSAGFKDIAHHSGEPWDGTDWTLDIQADQVVWSTEDHAVNPIANALRWGTLYNFWFDADEEPGQDVDATVLLFQPGSPVDVEIAVLAPAFVCGSSTYCEPTVNSTGFAAVVKVIGSTSVAANSLQLRASPVPTDNGLFIYSPDEDSLPVGNGNLCIGGQTLGFIVRCPGISAAGNVAIFNLDLTDPPVPAGQILPGTTWNFTYWYRDHPAGGSEFNFSNGARINFCP